VLGLVPNPANPPGLRLNDGRGYWMTFAITFFASQEPSFYLPEKYEGSPMNLTALSSQARDSQPPFDTSETERFVSAPRIATLAYTKRAPSAPADSQREGRAKK